MCAIVTRSCIYSNLTRAGLRFPDIARRSDSNGAWQQDENRVRQGARRRSNLPVSLRERATGRAYSRAQPLPACDSSTAWRGRCRSNARGPCASIDARCRQGTGVSFWRDTRQALTRVSTPDPASCCSAWEIVFTSFIGTSDMNISLREAYGGCGSGGELPNGPRVAATSSANARPTMHR